MKVGERRRKTAKIATQRHFFSTLPTLRSTPEQISIIFVFEHKLEARLDNAQVENKHWGKQMEEID